MTCLWQGILAVGLGIMHVLLVNADTIVSYAPVDYVNNAIIVANWDATENKKKGVSDTPIYTVSSSKCNTQWSKYFILSCFLYASVTQW